MSKQYHVVRHVKFTTEQEKEVVLKAMRRAADAYNDALQAAGIQIEESWTDY
jgi:hypothetical protein